MDRSNTQGLAINHMGYPIEGHDGQVLNTPRLSAPSSPLSPIDEKSSEMNNLDAAADGSKHSFGVQYTSPSPLSNTARFHALVGSVTRDNTDLLTRISAARDFYDAWLVGLLAAAALIAFFHFMLALAPTPASRAASHYLLPLYAAAACAAACLWRQRARLDALRWRYDWCEREVSGAGGAPCGDEDVCRRVEELWSEFADIKGFPDVELVRSGRRSSEDAAHAV